MSEPTTSAERQPVPTLLEDLEKRLLEMPEQHARELAEIKKRHVDELDEIKRAIAAVKMEAPNKRIGKMRFHSKVVEGKDVDVIISWKGMGIPDATIAFLANHHGGPVSFSDLMEGLKVRGVWLGDPAKPNRYMANLKTSVVNNKKRFKYDKRSDTVKLIDPGPEAASL